MTRTIITSWAETKDAIDTLLSMSQKTILVFDKDLTSFNLDHSERAELLRNFLKQDRNQTLKIVLHDVKPFSKMPRLLRLLTDYSQRFQVRKGAPALARLKDSLFLVDQDHAYIRFHQEQVRAKLLIEEEQECSDYLMRFENIWAEGGTPISPDTLGL